MRAYPRLSRCAQWVLALPYLLIGTTVMMAGAAGTLAPAVALGVFIVAGLLATTLLRGSLGKYPVAVLAILLWCGGIGLAMGVLPLWIGLLLGGAALTAIGMLSVLAALPWAAARQARLQARGRATIDWEWVHVPRDFAVSHPLFRLSPGIYLVAATLMASAGTAVALASGAGLGMPWVYVVFVGLTLGAVFLKAAVAYPMVFVGLLGGVPFSLPLIIYWADGVRPNLIYRHRFERLTPQENAHV